MMLMMVEMMRMIQKMMMRMYCVGLCKQSERVFVSISICTQLVKKDTWKWLYNYILLINYHQYIHPHFIVMNFATKWHICSENMTFLCVVRFKQLLNMIWAKIGSAVSGPQCKLNAINNGFLVLDSKIKIIRS